MAVQWTLLERTTAHSIHEANRWVCVGTALRLSPSEYFHSRKLKRIFRDVWRSIHVINWIKLIQTSCIRFEDIQAMSQRPSSQIVLWKEGIIPIPGLGLRHCFILFCPVFLLPGSRVQKLQKRCKKQVVFSQCHCSRLFQEVVREEFWELFAASYASARTSLKHAMASMTVPRFNRWMYRFVHKGRIEDFMQSSQENHDQKLDFQSTLFSHKAI